MELPVIRSSAAAAQDAAIGINAMLAALPLDTGDPTPSPVTVYNSVDHGWVARQTVPESGSGITFPAVAILISEPATIDPVHTTVRDGHYAVAYCYVEKKSDSAAGRRDALYAQRAILRHVTLLAAPSPVGQAFRLRTGIGMIAPESILTPAVSQPWGSALVTSAVVVHWLVRETSA